MTRRTLTLTEEMLRGYSRRGNYHSDREHARRLGLPGLLAQGMQVAGPAYDLALDAFGEEFLAAGELDLKFVGRVWDGETVTADIAIDPGGAQCRIEVVNDSAGTTAVAGTARRSWR